MHITTYIYKHIFCVCNAGIVVSIYILRYALSSDIGDSNAQTVASICNALQIQIVNYIYRYLW